MGHEASKPRSSINSLLPLAQIERIYSLPPDQLLRFSQICGEQKRHETEIKYVSDTLPAAGAWSIAYQTGQRIVLRVTDQGVVRDTWLVTAQTDDTIELHTAQWYVRQAKIPYLHHDTPGLWVVSFTSPTGVSLKCVGVATTTPARTLWAVDTASSDTIVLHTVQWYRRPDTQGLRLGAHRVKLPLETPPPSPTFHFSNLSYDVEEDDDDGDHRR